jgi:hypothetical protein
MAYGIGSRGFSPTGAFQILRVDGNPGLLDGERATKWQVRFLGMPGSSTATGARDAINGLTSCKVLIGDSFSQDVALSEKNTVRPSNSPRVFKGDSRISSRPTRFQPLIPSFRRRSTPRI